jgi:hypothetical protein
MVYLGPEARRAIAQREAVIANLADLSDDDVFEIYHLISKHDWSNYRGYTIFTPMEEYEYLVKTEAYLRMREIA